ncbi:helix-turn-helix transcriptional regulator [Subtercola lobariae]|uniref:helix-turn-helix transcriptional regulator n=1 Tax=Subtercola lobariae TaxID=1588641 RepID=UPI001669F952|nr:LuxR family transcriptional regulator [Subtercola lobariae]
MTGSMDVQAEVAHAITLAESGTPTVLDLEGHAGFGKTYLAREVARRFSADRVLRATAYEDTQSDPLSLLQQLGVPVAGLSSNALSASRALGAHLDTLPGTGPVIVVLDDLQWADPESLDAVGVLMERMAGDRVLVVAGHRPIGSRHARWVTRLRDVPSVVRVVLAGLDDEETLALLHESTPEAPLSLAKRLRVHTGGSPLFIRSLLHEYAIADLELLAERHELPASQELVATMGERLSRLDPAAVATLSAIAVIGVDGAEPFILSAVADVSDVTTALDILAKQGLVVIDRASPAARARIFHGVVQAAVYDNIPPATRERMHAIAAARLTSPGERLRHRVAAARSADDGLAADLGAFADALHEAGRYREAARFRRQAAQLSSDPDERGGLILDADLESIFALDLDDLSVDERDVGLSTRARLVVGSKLAAQRRFVEASDILTSLTDPDLDSLDPLAAYRARVMRAWSLVAAGRSAAAALHDLDIAETGSVTDAAVRGYAVIARGQAAQRVAPVEQRMSIPGLLSVDRAQLASSPQGVIALAWRGAVMSLTGMPNEAIGDLTLVTSRFGAGQMEFADGVFHALQGFAYFVNGQWPRAEMMIDLSRGDRPLYAAPLSAAIEPLAGVIAGDPDRARAALGEARRIRIHGPQPAAVHAGDIVDVLTLFFVGSLTDQTDWLEGRIRDLGSPDDWADEQVPHLWYVAQAIGAGWAGHPEAAIRWAELLRTVDPPPWSSDIADWLEARVDTSPIATIRLAELARAGLSLPVLNALLQVDVAQRTVTEPERSARRMHAASVLRALGADHLAKSLRDEPNSAMESEPENSLLSVLSEREREVAALILEGLSYTQVAKELFITRSTVSFHLSRIYAKTGTNSRHELIAAARQNSV